LGGAKKRLESGQKGSFAQTNLLFPYIYHADGGQFGGEDKTYLLAKKDKIIALFAPLDKLRQGVLPLADPLDPPVA